jgi:hypothetical protein
MYVCMIDILYMTLTAGWSCGLRFRLRNQRSRVQIPVFFIHDTLLNGVTLLHYHHQPINVPGHRPFPGSHIRRTNPPRGPSADWWVLTTANAAGPVLTCLPKHRARNNNSHTHTHKHTHTHTLLVLLSNSEVTFEILCLVFTF